MKLTLFSCVGGGPMARLAKDLRGRGRAAELRVEMSAERWRELASQGSIGRLRARLKAMVVFPLRAMLTTLEGDVGTLVPTTNPFFVPVLLVATKAIHGRPVVPLIYDLYPDAVEASGHAKISPALMAVAKTLNRFLFAHADGVVFIGARMAAHATATYGDTRAHVVIHTGASLDEFAALREQASKIDEVCGVNVAGKRLISYVGNMGQVHEWETLRDGLAQLIRAEPTNAAVIISASGPGVEFLKRELPAGSDRLIHFVSPTNDDEWQRLMVRTDVALVTLREAAKNTSVPSKTFSAMAAGAAIIAITPRTSDLADVVTNADCGAVVAPGNGLQFLDATLRFLRDPDELARLQKNALEAIEEQYEMSSLAERWADFADRVAIGNHPGFGYTFVKRAFDIACSATALVASAPVLLGGALAVRASMGSPVLFRQRRPGKDGVPLELFKFRSMREAQSHEIGPEHDGTRLTRVGAFLRKTSIDELPALLNVLVGDMSLVGPRPLLVRYLTRYSKTQARRHEVTPGITGLAQVSGRNAITWDEKFEHDVHYVDNRGLWLDFSILVRTVLSVFQRQGIAQEGHATMAEFMGAGGGAS